MKQTRMLVIQPVHVEINRIQLVTLWCTMIYDSRLQAVYGRYGSIKTEHEQKYGVTVTLQDAQRKFRIINKKFLSDATEYNETVNNQYY